MKQEQESKQQLITFNSLHIEVLGPKELRNSQLAIRGVTEFLHGVELDVGKLLRERAEISPILEGFRLRFR
jgi:hypothetical protein